MASISAGGNMEVGNMISTAMEKVGRKGVISLEESRGVENDLYVVEGVAAFHLRLHVIVSRGS